MSRRRFAEKRSILPDPKYQDTVLAKCINMIMRNGKKSVAEKIVYGALKEIENNRGKEEVIEVFNKALENIRPFVEVRSKRVGGAAYQIPIEIRYNRGQTLAIRWLIDAARKRSEKDMGLRLANELLDAVENRGSAVKKREEAHRLAEANKAFSHFRW